jgi:guanylate kinase
MIDYILHIGGRGGSWKTTIIDVLNEKLWLEKTKNYTSRKPRFPGEWGYFFVTEDDFISRLRDNQIIECYFRKSNNSYYGLPAPTQTGIVNCEIMGLVALKKWCFQNNVKFLSIYLDVNRDTLYNRIKNRWDVNEKPEDRLREDEYYEIFKNVYDIIYDYNNKTVEEGFADIMNMVKTAGIIA